MMQKVIYNIRYVHNYNKTHLQKQNQTYNTQHSICEIHVSRYIFIFISMLNMTLVTYLLIELLTDTALSHVLFVLHVPTGIT
jgi:hypothetical protein